MSNGGTTKFHQHEAKFPGYDRDVRFDTSVITNNAHFIEESYLAVPVYGSDEIDVSGMH